MAENVYVLTATGAKGVEMYYVFNDKEKLKLASFLIEGRYSYEPKEKRLEYEKLEEELCNKDFDSIFSCRDIKELVEFLKDKNIVYEAECLVV